MRLKTLLVLTTAAAAIFAPAASASISSPPDWGQPGPSPAVTHQTTFAGGCIASAFRPFRAGGSQRSVVATGGVYCFRRVRSMSVLVCTDIDAPNSVWPVGGLTSGSSWRPVSCTAAPDAAGAWRLGARDVNTGAGCASTYPWWPGNPTVRTEVVAQFATRTGASFHTLDYSRPVTLRFHGTCPSGGGGSGGGGGVVAQ